MASGIVPGKRYNLMHHNRGLHVRAHTDWDWVFAADKEGDPGEPVIFHEHKDSRYLIQHTYCDWGGYDHWQLGTTGVSLNKPESATAWDLYPTENGFVLGKGENYLILPTSGTRWLQGKFHLSSGISASLDLSSPNLWKIEGPQAKGIAEFQAVPA